MSSHLTTDQPATEQVADDVFVVTGTAVNWVLLREGTDLTLIDAGWPGDTQAVERSIRALGRRPEDLRGILLTHAHVDHTGALTHLATTYGVPAYAAAAELPNAWGQQVETGGPRDVARYLYRPQVVRWAVQIVEVGGTRHRTVPSVRAMPEGPLDLPGRPVPVPTPGHTSGHTSYLLPHVGAVVTGDTLVTGHPTLRGLGPRLLPDGFSHDPSEVIGSLRTLRGLDAEILVPGHGPAWYGPIGAAADEALAHVRRT